MSNISISCRYPEFLLPDGSLRTTFAKDSADVTTTADYPPCLAQTSSVISRHFDSVYTSISNLFEELTGKVFIIVLLCLLSQEIIWPA